MIAVRPATAPSSGAVASSSATTTGHRGLSVFETLRCDFARYRHAQRAHPPLRATLHAAFSYGFLAVCVYRYGRWVRGLHPRPLRQLLLAPYLLLVVMVHLLLGIDISLNACIGPGLYIAHFGGIFLHCDAGRNLSVGQGVTLGYKGAGMSDDWPTIGDDVYVGAGAKVIGGVTVGDGVVVGANAVVTRDVAARMRVVGGAMRITPLAPDA